MNICNKECLIQLSRLPEILVWASLFCSCLHTLLWTDKSTRTTNVDILFWKSCLTACVKLWAGPQCSVLSELCLPSYEPMILYWTAIRCLAGRNGQGDGSLALCWRFHFVFSGLFTLSLSVGPTSSRSGWPVVAEMDTIFLGDLIQTCSFARFQWRKG